MPDPFDIGPERLTNSDIDVSSDENDNLVIESVRNGNTLTVDEDALLSEAGGADRSVTSQTSAYTAEDEDVVLVDASSDPVTVTLPAAEENISVVVEKTDDSDNDVTIEPDDAGDVNYSSEETLIAQGESVDLVCDGTDWYSI